MVKTNLSSLLKKGAFVAIACAAAMVYSPSQADAQVVIGGGRSCGVGGSGFSVSIGRGIGGYYGGGFYNGFNNFGPNWHRSSYNYYRPSYRAPSSFYNYSPRYYHSHRHCW